MPLFVKDVTVQNIMVLDPDVRGVCRRAGTFSPAICGQINIARPRAYFGLGAYTTELLFTKFGVLPCSACSAAG